MTPLQQAIENELEVLIDREDQIRQKDEVKIREYYAKMEAGLLRRFPYVDPLKPNFFKRALDWVRQYL